ncbi:YhdP family protein [Solimonas soli]|uniref:YhdP family protein n=1 Tax=Solimonas soli TaxID=413479 RepID=UPI00048531B7|nr:YhdP family protein [Solimonas soli]
MERVKRRWWTWAITLLATVVIFGAVISGLFQLAVLALPSYRADLSAWVTHVANRPVQIGGVNLGWHGIEPQLELSDITLFSEDGDESLTLDRLDLGFSLLRLVVGNAFPDRLEVAGLTISVERDDNGGWRIAGFAPGATGAPGKSREAWARDLARFRHLVLSNCTIIFSGTPYGSDGQQLRVAKLKIDQGEDNFEIGGRLQLPVTYGDTIEVSADIDGSLLLPQQWQGDFELDLRRLRPQGWLAPYLQRGVQIGAENFDIGVEGSIAAGRVAHADLAVDSGALVVAHDGQASGARKARLRASVRNEQRSWIVDLKELRFDDERLAHGSLRWAGDAQGRELDADIDELRLARLTPWLAVWRDTPAPLAQAARLSGVLDNLVLRLRRDDDGATRYSATGRLDGVALAADAHFGFAGLSGELSASEAGGQLRLQQVPLRLELPATLQQALQFESVDAQLQWTRGTDGWRITGPAFGWRLAGTTGSGNFELQLPADAERSPQLDLQARFSGQDVNRLKPYMPLHWSEHLRDWLDKGLARGRVPRAELAIHGPLRDFPFAAHPTGSWKLDLDAAGVALAFAPGWPRLDDVAARLEFSGASLVVTGTGGKLNGNRIDRAVARFDDFATSVLTVDAASSGEISRFYDFLADSPLHPRLSGLLDQTRAAGNARVGVELVLPLHDIKSTTVRGSVALDNVQMYYSKLDQPISGISGVVEFDDHGASGEGLSARFEDLPLAVRIVPREGTHGVVVAEFPFAVDPDGRGASQFVPAFLRGALNGRSSWRAELPILEHPEQGGGTALTLSSDLRGTAVALPEPLGKPAEASVPLALRIGGDSAAPLRIGVRYAQKLGADLALGEAAADQDAGKRLRLDGMQLRFGGVPPPKASKGRYLVDGSADTLDLAAWVAMIGGMGGEGEGSGVSIEQIDLDVAHLRWRHQISGATHLRWTPLQGGWRANLSGDGAQGVVEYAGPAPGRLVARLERLQLAPQTPPGEAPAAEKLAARPAAKPDAPTEPPLEPARWPELDAICERLSADGHDMGRLELKSVRVPGGQRLDRFTMGGGIVDVDASGQWRHSEGRSSAELRLQFVSSDFQAVLKALDFEPNLEAKQTHIDADLRWAPSPTGLVWQAAAGRVDLQADSGKVRTIKPGASRVLGLLNFYALPRRLTLNFSDVTDDALAFDRVEGHFDLGGGAATTDDLTVRGPSLRIDMRGRIGLVARDYDQRVTVYPAGMSSGVTLGAALLGGPAVGAIVLLAQEVLDKPLDQVTQLTYHVSGSWDNPKVEKLDARSARPAERSKETKRK